LGSQRLTLNNRMVRRNSSPAGYWKSLLGFVALNRLSSITGNTSPLVDFLRDDSLRSVDQPQAEFSITCRKFNEDDGKKFRARWKGWIRLRAWQGKLLPTDAPGAKVGLKGCLHLSLDCEYSLKHKTRAGWGKESAGLIVGVNQKNIAPRTGITGGLFWKQPERLLCRLRLRRV